MADIRTATMFGVIENTIFRCREPDKLRIFVNYALKTPEYECLSNFSRITYCCHFSAYARGFALFRTYESRSGDAEFGR